MAGVLSNATGIKRESTFGVAAVANIEGLEAQEDTFVREPIFIEDYGRRQGQETLRSDRTSTTIAGVAGSLNVSLKQVGAETYIRDILGAFDNAPAQPGTATNPVTYIKEFHSDSDGPGELATDPQSVTIYHLRNRQGTGRPSENVLSQYRGCVVKSGSLTVAKDTPVMVMNEYTGLAVADITTSPPAINAYTAGARAYEWRHITGFKSAANKAGLSGADNLAGVEAFTFNWDLGLLLDARYADGENIRAYPRRISRPAYSGTLDIVHSAATQTAFRARFAAGTISALSFEMAHGVNRFSLTFPSIRIDSANLVSSLDDLTKMQVSWTALHNGTDHAVEGAYQTAGATW